MTERLSLTFIIDDVDCSFVVHGHDVWALRQLLEAGDKGCTPTDNPAPRWSVYIHKLRKLGLDIETIHEAHRGPFPGTHAGYVLRSKVILHSSKEMAV